MMMPPFMMNFMLEVPLASMPAVEMCWAGCDVWRVMCDV
jgi:hypothetical protein